MTCREKLKKDHPELVDDIFCGGCAKCPHSYGYLSRPDYCGLYGGTDEWCTKCWDREIDEKGEI